MNMLKKIGLVVGCGVLSAVLVAGALWLTQPHEYSSQIRLLVVQKYTLTDSYTAAKSAEKNAKDLANLVVTSAFIEEVAQSKTVNIDSILALPEEDKRKEWRKKVTTEQVPNTSLLEVTVYDTSPQQAEVLVDTIAKVLVDNSDDFLSAGDTIDLRVVDWALTSSYPVRPNVMMYGFAAGLLGGLIALMILFLNPSVPFSAQRFDIWKRRSQEKRAVYSQQKKEARQQKEEEYKRKQEKRDQELLAKAEARRAQVTPPVPPVAESVQPNAAEPQPQTPEYSVLHVANFHTPIKKQSDEHKQEEAARKKNKRNTPSADKGFDIMPQALKAHHEQNRPQPPAKPGT